MFIDYADPNVEPPDFRYLPLHDLESMWWIAAQFLTARAVTHCDPDDLDRSHYSKHAKFAKQLFGRDACRASVMTSGLSFFHDTMTTTRDV